MSKEAIIYITIGVYLLLMLLVGILSRRAADSISDFTVGKRNANAWFSAFSYGTAYFSAVMFIGYSGTTGWNYGLWGVLPGIGNAVFGSLFAWLVLANRTREITRRLNIRSMPQFFEKRFGSEAMKLFCVFTIFIFLIPYSASVYNGLSSVCSILLNVDEMLCKVIIAAVAALLVTLGGYVATLKADFLQGIIMIGGVSALVVVLVRSDNVGGLSEGLRRITDATDALNLGATDHIGLWATVLMTSFGTWGLPQMIHKFYGIKDRTQVRRGVIISTGFAVIIAVGGYFIGSLSRLFPDSFAGGKFDHIIPNMLNTAQIPNVLLGIILVLLISASVSTLASITITAATTLTMDFIQPKLMRSVLPTGTSVLCKVISLAFIVLSFFLAITDTPILILMSYSWGIISGSFMAPYMISLYWKKLNKFGAWCGMLGGFVAALPPLACKLLSSDAELSVGSLSFGKLSSLGPHFACVSMIVSVILCFVGTWVYEAVRGRQKLNEEFYAIGAYKEK